MGDHKGRVLIKRAIKKQIHLRNILFWKNEIPENVYPIVWFGNHTKQKKIVTLGANPSIKEFFKTRKNKEPVFRDGGEERLYILKDYNLKQVIVQERELLKIIAGFKNYFYPNPNPYEGWFGAKNGGRLEAFLNGFSASF